MIFPLLARFLHRELQNFTIAKTAFDPTSNCHWCSTPALPLRTAATLSEATQDTPWKTKAVAWRTFRSENEETDPFVLVCPCLCENTTNRPGPSKPCALHWRQPTRAHGSQAPLALSASIFSSFAYLERDFVKGLLFFLIFFNLQGTQLDHNWICLEFTGL